MKYVSNVAVKNIGFLAELRSKVKQKVRSMVKSNSHHIANLHPRTIIPRHVSTSNILQFLRYSLDKIFKSQDHHGKVKSMSHYEVAHLNPPIPGTLFINIDDICCFRQGYQCQCLQTYINIAILSKTINLHCKCLKKTLNLKKLHTLISHFCSFQCVIDEN